MTLSALGAFQDAIHRRVPPGMREFVKFGIVGTVGFVVDFTTYTILTRPLGWDTIYCLGFGGGSETLALSEIQACTNPRYPIVAANMVSVLIAVSSNFLLNKFWTFRDPRRGVLAAQGVAYVVLNIITWTLNQFLTGLFASRLAILHLLFPRAADLAAKILAVLVVLFFNFTGSKFMIFKRSSS